MLSRLFVAFLAAAMLGPLVSVAQAADPLEIPAILPNTGGAAFLGKEFSDSLRLLEERVNKTGGIKGRPIHFAIQDDQSTPQVTVQLTNAALAKNPIPNRGLGRKAMVMERWDPARSVWVVAK